MHRSCTRVSLHTISVPTSKVDRTGVATPGRFPILILIRAAVGVYYFQNFEQE
jgi:hypothetical protein